MSDAQSAWGHDVGASATDGESEQPDPHRPARVGAQPLITVASSMALLYPLVVIGALYGEWLVAWAALGHPPRPSLDDPKYVPYSRHLHMVTGLLFMGFAPAACLALPLALIDAFRRRRPIDITVVSLLALVATWVIALLFLRADPWEVMYWWFD